MLNTEKIHKLITMGKEAVNLSEISQLDEPSLRLTWRTNGLLELEFYSYSLEVGGDTVGNHSFTVANEEELDNLLDHLVSIVEREIVALSKKYSGSGCN